MIQTIVALNNRGVGYLQSGDHELARIAFKQALERTTYLLNLNREARELCRRNTMAARLGGHATNSCPRMDPSSNTLEDHLLRRCNVSPRSRQATPQVAIHMHHYQQDHTPSQQLPQHPQVRQRLDSVQRIPISTSLTSRYTGSFISSHALLLSDECCMNPIEFEYCLRESACVMFNLALVHHWRGMRFGISSLLPKALKLYEMSFSLIRNGSSFDTQHLILALLNNMGQIHYEMMQYNNARQCFKDLKDLLTTRAATSADGPDVQGFLMNIMFLEAPQVAPAA